MKLSVMIQVVKFFVWLIPTVRALVVEVETQIPESGKGAEKFATVKRALTLAATYAGVSKEILETVDGVINGEIEAAVSEKVNHG